MRIDIERKEGYLKIEAEIKVVAAPAKEYPDEEARKGLSLEPSEGAQLCQFLDFGFLAYRTVKA